MLWALNILLLAFLLATALLVVLQDDLLVSGIILSGFGLLMAILWTRLGSPDLALIFAALNVSVTTVLIVIAINRTSRKDAG